MSLAVPLAAAPAGPADNPLTGAPMLSKYCVQCHGAKSGMGGIRLPEMAAPGGLVSRFDQWEKVIHAVEQHQMPPRAMPQPTDAERTQAVTFLRTRLTDLARQSAGDPGRVTLRRLTSGEYAYTIADLTGLDFRLDRDFVADAVGGEGFTNFGDLQFLGDANLERYLASAKRIASHAVIGAGPLAFYADPGKSGLELSALNRIRDIYENHGFRASSGEGGLPYGMERYGRAFYAAWHYRHRAALGEPKLTIAALAAREQLPPRFLEHMVSVTAQAAPSYPTSGAVNLWKRLPAPAGDLDQAKAAARKACQAMQVYIIDWPRMLFGAGETAKGGQGDERSLVISEDTIQGRDSQHLKFNLRNRKKTTLTVYLIARALNPPAKDKGVVQWKNGVVRFRRADRELLASKPIAEVLTPETRRRLGWPETGAAEIETTGEQTAQLDLITPADAAGLEIQIDPTIVDEPARDAVLRCTIADTLESAKGAPVAAIIGHPSSPGFAAWKRGVLEFDRLLPQASQAEAAPSDKDPIPAPFNNTYNQPERDIFHLQLKYNRDDQFLVEKMLDEPTRRRLDQAWADLFYSIDYQNVYARFVANKFKVDLHGKTLDTLTPAELAALPAEPARYIKRLHTDWLEVRRQLLLAQPGHLDDAIQWASQAWRRPLTPAEKDTFRAFYTRSREILKLNHDQATRALLARVLVAPDFLYRLEGTAETSAARPLTSWEMASRLSYFLWSSAPDAELRRAAAAGELTRPDALERQTRRMLADPKARRFATEFFGQWLGFYRFDEYGGVDTGRYPEFNADLKSAMYDEAVTFFEHIVREKRPVREILFADYAFLNPALAKHYGAAAELPAGRQLRQVPNAAAFHRGGMLRLGAVLTSTSAPLRTSPVKRGDWVLRRLLGTPTPPPPANAGTIPADDKGFGGLSVRQRLAAHQRNATCAGCHSRIDPLGFPLERYDAVGRWREAYPDGKPIDDSSVTIDKQDLSGVDGLLSYARAQEPQILRNLSRKMLGYALGRTIQLSDQPLLEALTRAGGEATFPALCAEIVKSKQFRTRREPAEGPSPAAPPHQSASLPAARPQPGAGGTDEE